MHHYKDENISVNYNSDFSGDIYLTNRSTGDVVEVNGKSLVDFVFESYIKSELINHIEQQSIDEFLKMAGKIKR